MVPYLKDLKEGIHLLQVDGEIVIKILDGEVSAIPLDRFSYSTQTPQYKENIHNGLIFVMNEFLRKDENSKKQLCDIYWNRDTEEIHIRYGDENEDYIHNPYSIKKNEIQMMNIIEFIIEIGL